MQFYNTRMEITTYQISEAVDFRDYSRGKQYFLASKVISYKTHNINAYEINIHSKVKGSYQASYSQNINIKPKLLNDVITIDGHCSCPVGYNCKHVVAACFQYQYDQTHSPSKVVDNWINKLISDKSIVDTITTNNSSEFFLYRLFETRTRDELKIYQSRILNNGNVGRGSKVTMYAFTYTHMDIMDRHDKQVMHIVSDLKDDHYYYRFKGTIGYLLIKALINTGRCFYKTSKQALQLNPEILTPNYKWTKIDNNYKKLSFDLPIKNHHIVNTRPLMVIDTDHHQVYQLHNAFSLDTLKLLSKAPKIPNKQVSKVYQKLTSHVTGISISVPKDFKTQTLDTPPIPVITIGQENFSDGVGFYVELSFLYQTFSCHFQPREAQTHQFNDDGQTLITRHLEQEQQALEQLTTYGLDLFDEQSTYFSFPTKESLQTVLTQWQSFLENTVPELKEKGWQIIIEESFKLSFNTDADIVVASDEESSDWFSLSFDINVNGKSYPLAPMVSSVLNEFDDLDALPKKLLVAVEPLQYIELPTQALKPVLKTLLELFDRTDDNNLLKIGAFDAHMLEEMDDSIIWKGSKEILKLSKKLKSFEGIKDTSPPICLKLELRDYQQAGLNWLNFLYDFKFSGILADDMGLGKTVQTLSLLSRLKEKNKLKKPALIIVPTSLIANWKNEVKKFTPNLNVVTLYGSDRAEHFSQIQKSDIILTTYTLVSNDIEQHKKRKHSYIILDEAQKIKNPRTKMAKTICSLKSENRLALTGTPIENHLGELWSIFNFLMPGFLHSQKLFNDYYRKPIENNFDAQMQEQLNKRIKPFILRRTKGDVLTELPAKTEIIKLTQFDEKQSKLYETIRITMNKKVRDTIAEKGLNKSHIHILDALLKLRQVCCDPSILKLAEAKKVKESAKLNLFLDLIDELMAEGRKVLVFSQFTTMLSILEREIKKKKISYVKLTGSSTKREKIIDKFTNGEADIFLISLKAGGVGLNLVEADTVIHYDPWWNPAVENQATDRAHRIGQNKKVFVYKLIVENTIEQKILELQKKKQALQDGIYDKGGKLEEKKLNGNELMELLKG